MLIRTTALSRGISALALATAGVLGASLLTEPAAAAAAPSITINDPGALTAGPIKLTGTVAAGDLTTTVLFMVDVSTSTAHPDGMDCNGDGVATPVKDNINGDNMAGDVLDCELGAVQALNQVLASSPAASKILVGLERFNTAASTIPLASGSPFVGAAVKDANGQLVLSAEAAKQQRATTIGTDYNRAVDEALKTLKSAPAGPKWIIMLSDGKAESSPSVAPAVAALKASTVRLRAFAPTDQPGSKCAQTLLDLTGATGQTCVTSNPAQLGSQLTAAQTDTVSAVRVTIGSQTFPTTLDLAGGWRADLTIGAGTYIAKATATLGTGRTISAERSFTVAPASGGTAPPPGAVTGTPGTASGTPLAAGGLSVVPAPTLGKLPSVVRGRVGTRSSSATPIANAGLEGATVLLQGQRKGSTVWRTVARSAVSRGAYTLTWTPRTKVNRLRVTLLPYRTFTGAMKLVPRPGISSCIRRGASSWTFRCATTAKNGTHARLLRKGHVVARTKVVRHHVTVSGTGRPARYVLVVDLSKRQHLRLRL